MTVRTKKNSNNKKNLSPFHNFLKLNMLKFKPFLHVPRENYFQQLAVSGQTSIATCHSTQR